MDLESIHRYEIVDLKNRPLAASRLQFLPTPVNHHRNATVLAYTLCAKCSSIRDYLQQELHCLSWARYSTDHGIHVDPENIVDLDYHKCGLELERAYLDGCHICSIVWEYLLHLQEDLSLRKVQATSLRRVSQLYMQIDWLSLKVGVQDEFRMHGLLQTMRFKLMICPRQGFKSPHLHPTGEWELPIYPISISNASEESFRVARSWIKECRDSHRTCKKKHNNVLPRRLLDLQGVEPHNEASIFHLISTDNVPRGNIQYAALSYCRGTDLGFKLTSKTFESLTLGMTVKVLPKTLREAMYAARSLSMDWIWIDSMCIMQDSAADWKREAMIMGDIYQNSEITISAVGAKSSNEGLYSYRDPLGLLPCPFVDLDDNPEFEPGLVVQLEMNKDSIRPDFPDFWPLHQRGWTLQERILPTKILGFGPELYWSCRESSRLEFGIGKAPENLNSKFFKLVLEYQKGDLEQEEKIFKYWETVWHIYTASHLTFKSDKLLAISGLIRIMQSSLGWTNLSGLWQPFLREELMWVKSTEVSFSHQPTGLYPTWSWIKIHGQLERHISIDQSQPLPPISRIENCETSPEAPTSVGDYNILRSSLRITCLPLNIRELPQDLSTPDYDEEIDSGFEVSLPPCADTKFILKSSMLDCVTLELDFNDFPDFLLPLGACTNDEVDGSGGGGVYGLAVMSSKICPEAFERTGVFHIKLTVLEGKYWRELMSYLQDVSKEASFILV